MLNTVHNADDGAPAESAPIERRNSLWTTARATAGLAYQQGKHPLMPMTNLRGHNEQTDITHDDAAEVNVLINVNNNVSGYGNPEGHTTKTAENIWVQAAANYRNHMAAPERAAGVGVLSTLPPPSPPPSPPQRAKRTRTSVRAKLSADADRLQGNPAQVPADRAPDAEASLGVLSLAPPPSPPPAPPVRRADWVGYVRFSELSPDDKEIHDAFTAVVIRAENEAAEARMAEQAARAELTKFRLAHGMRGNTGVYRTCLTETRATDYVAPADRPFHPHFIKAIKYDSDGFVLGTHYILRPTRRKFAKPRSSPWRSIFHQHLPPKKAAAAGPSDEPAPAARAYDGDLNDDDDTDDATPDPAY